MRQVKDRCLGVVSMVRAYNKRVVPGRVGGIAMASGERGLYRLRTVNGAPYGAVSGRWTAIWDGAVGVVLTGLRLILAISILLFWVLGEFLYRDTPVTVFGLGGGWLTLAHVLVPLGFFSLFLTNRRFGPGLTFAQLAGASLVVAVVALISGGDLNELLPGDTIPDLREAIAFGSAFFAASLVSITVFDGARGPFWWTAPLFGFVSAAIVFAAVFFPALHAGTGQVWLFNGLEYMALLTAEGLCLLIPFWALRRALPPTGGLGGY